MGSRTKDSRRRPPGQQSTEEYNSDVALRLVVEQLPALVWTTDANLRITSVIGADQLRPKRPPAMFVGQALTAILGEEAMVLPVIPAHHRALAGESARYERAVNERVFDVRVQPLRDHQGNTFGCIGIAFDITERKRDEQWLATQNAVSRVLAEANTLDGVARGILEAIGSCLEWECGALWVVDRKAGALTCAEVWHAPNDDFGTFITLTRKMRCQPGNGLPGRVWGAREPIWIADVAEERGMPRLAVAAERGLHASFGLPILIGDEVIGVLEFFSRRVRFPDSAVLDLVSSLGQQIGQFIERKRAEAAAAAAEQQLVLQRTEAALLAERERLRRQFLLSISHDLRTPLTSARAALGLLETQFGARLENQGEELVANAWRGIERLRLLIDDLLAANQIAAGVAFVQRGPLDLRSVVTSAAASLQELITRKGQLLELKLPSPLPITGDSAALEQVVLNLIANAHYHTPACTRIMIVGWCADGEIRLSVRDNGPGIPSEMASVLFEPFHRLGSEAVGSGLGLATARSIVELHGGRLWLETGEGEGALFHIALPCTENERG
jgi:signal transduction histidine kinase